MKQIRIALEFLFDSSDISYVHSSDSDRVVGAEHGCRTAFLREGCLSLPPFFPFFFPFFFPCPSFELDGHLQNYTY